MMKYAIFWTTSTLLLLSSSWTNAETVFSQPTTLSAATMSDFDPSVAWGNHYQFAADDFALSEAAAITEVRWWGIYQKGQPAQDVQPPYPDPLPGSNFTIRFFNDDTGIPGNVELEFNSIGNCNPTPLVYTWDDGEIHYFEYNYKLAEPMNLEGGRTYWLSIADSTASFPDDIFFSWLKSDSSNWCYSHEPGGLIGWTPYNGSPGMAFDLIIGSAPCPSADLTGDCFVDFNDFAVMANQWLTGDPCDPCIPDDMVLIPAGTFEMGDHFSEGGSGELPVHSVYLDSFMMSCFEVTNEQYCKFLNNSLSRGQIEVRDGTVYALGGDDPYCDTKEANSRSRILFAGVPFTVEADKQYHPMVKVSWFGAVAFCNWKSEQEDFEPCYNLSTWTCDFTKTGFRLPTEAEREYAGRSGLSGKRYPWGDGIRVTSQANYSNSGDPYETGDYPWTTPVGFYDGQLRQKADFNWPGSQSSYQTTSGVNGYGLHDIAGNVWEWCNDWWAQAYYASSPGANPQGPADRTYRISRGGSWNWPAFDCRVSRRASDLPSSRFDNVGFRLALDLN